MWGHCWIGCMFIYHGTTYRKMIGFKSSFLPYFRSHERFTWETDWTCEHRAVPFFKAKTIYSSPAENIGTEMIHFMAWHHFRNTNPEHCSCISYQWNIRVYCLGCFTILLLLEVRVCNVCKPSWLPVWTSGMVDIPVFELRTQLIAIKSFIKKETKVETDNVE